MKILVTRISGEALEVEAANLEELRRRCGEIFGVERRKLMVGSKELVSSEQLEEGVEVLAVSVAAPLGLVTTTSGEAQIFEMDTGKMLERFTVSEEEDVMLFAPWVVCWP